jgi:trimeric autotransporter adhesin
VKNVLLSTIFTLVFTSIIFSQDFPTTINYQGILKDAAGNIVENGNYDITFNLYNIESGGSSLWNETQTINVTNGIINAKLGSANPYSSLIFAEARWLGMTVGAETELTPRIALTSVPYSFYTMNVLNGSITASKIADGQVVKSLNGLKDIVNLVAGSNVTITPSGNDITISSNGGGSGIGGNGTTNYLPFFTGITTLGNSVIYQTGSNIGIGTITPAAKLEISGGDALINGLTVGKGPGNITTNSAFGYQALFSNTTRYNNTANGFQTLYSNTEGNYNTANGIQALYFNTTGNGNTANGFQTLSSNTTGHDNTANGHSSLFMNTTGSYNMANGPQSLYSNTTGEWNTANGWSALYSNTTSDANTANGYASLYSNTTGLGNTATGVQTLYSNTEGYWNTATGLSALYYNATGVRNTAYGSNALYYNSTGNLNTALGEDVYPFDDDLDNWTGIGFSVGGAASTSNSVEIGNMSVTWIGGQVGWSTYSDARIKENISENVPGLAFINKLRPVSYNLNIHKQNEMMYKGKKEQGDWSSKYDIENMRMTGFIAQEVEKAAQELNYEFSAVEKPKNENDLYSLRYSEFVVPLVKAVQEQQNEIKDQQKVIEELTKRIEQLERR